MRTNITHDPDLIAEIAARFDLREPNRQALDDLVTWLAGSEPDTDSEAVADLATGVGKTYLMSALVEYLAHQGVRNVLIVTPGSTIQRKTIDNFDAASRKYVPGADLVPVVITPETFRTAETGTLLHDTAALKVFVFNVQQLLAPTAEATRRTRQDDENIGGALYEHLQNATDLFVIADEHHLYSSRARAFNAAISDLGSEALIGLTATPAPEHLPKIRSRYTLGQAIADGYVKTPVIVYRRDGTTDERTQLRDACSLLRVKEQAYSAYRTANPDAAAVKPALFVVCGSIEHADQTGATLAQPDFIGDGDAVLHVTSHSTDEALQALADVENPDSPIRAIVSVNMLKEGWDVKNIAVIVALRTLASQALTEQILGRGLRLPFGARTGIAAVDQVDLVAHDSYRQLLDQRNVLVQRLQATPTTRDVDEHGAATVSPDPVGSGGSGQPAPSSGNAAPTADDSASDDAENSGTTESGGAPTDLDVPSGDGTTVIGFDETDTRTNTPPPQLHDRTPGSPQIVFPRREPRITRVDFTLANVPNSAAERAGQEFTRDTPTFIFRDALEAEHDGEDVRITVRPQEHARAIQDHVIITRVRDDLTETVLRQPEVPRTRESLGGCRRIVDAFLKGAGVTSDDQTAEWTERRRQAALEGIRALIRDAIRNRETRMEHVLAPITLSDHATLVHGDALDAYNDTFIRHTQFTGWQRSITPAVTFDARTTEWELAHLLDRDPNIAWWLRLTPNDPAYISLDTGGRYYPDFVAIDTSGTHWLIEGKADRHAADTDVTAKREAAETWARSVQDSGHEPPWRYMFATETHIRAAAGSWDALIAETRPE
ncbi:DEAD/DEAH box helicase family protein [Phycicoccus sp. BSK3Z-2]|uniref:DEAD/DEAH box helicase family protein n=1 Tax=Phycicoccus avicenniae TaxID=2828860 RepID=A0A941D9E3_9MICO|nr:DEAD/DEAH box helicase family protein [Phycicoccus avicenniae]MBR7744358.1 DEAD/DEAH box helicase family protein [Phycicoccus avicenniae]